MEMSLSVDHRMRKANGSYVKILRQTAVFEVDKISGKIHSTFSLCKDISTIKSSATIGWQVTGFDMVTFEAPEHESGRVHYRPTPREMDVVRKLAEGKSSKWFPRSWYQCTHRKYTPPEFVGAHRLSNTTELVERISSWVGCKNEKPNASYK